MQIKIVNPNVPNVSKMLIIPSPLFDLLKSTCSFHDQKEIQTIDLIITRVNSRKFSYIFFPSNICSIGINKRPKAVYK